MEHSRQHQLADDQSDIGRGIAERVRSRIGILRGPQHQYNQQDLLIMLENPLAQLYHSNLDSITARVNPSAQVRAVKLAMCSRLFRAMRCVPSRSCANCRIAETSPSMSPADTVRPFQPSLTRSVVAPATSVAITGSPHAIASFTTRPHGSENVGNTNASARP